MKWSKDQIEKCREQGFLLLENVVDTDMLVGWRDTLVSPVVQSHQVAASNGIYNLDQSHSAATPWPRLPGIRIRHFTHIPTTIFSCSVP